MFKNKWICTLDALPDDPNEHVLCLIEIVWSRAFLPDPPDEDLNKTLQHEIHCMSDHEAPFTGKYPEGDRHNWRCWYWQKLPKIPKKIRRP
jgi:hypothetical protein